PHHNPDCPSIMGRLWPNNTCARQANPVTIKESCNSGTISTFDKPNASPTVIGMTTILANRKKNHCSPAIQVFVSFNFSLVLLTLLFFFSFNPIILTPFYVFFISSYLSSHYF